MSEALICTDTGFQMIFGYHFETEANILIRIDPGSSLPVYVQIYRCIREDIVLGAYNSGDRLDSVRTAADNLNISKNTVARAYKQLSDEGYIENRPKSGYFVADLDDCLSRRALRSVPEEERPPDSRFIPPQKEKEFFWDFSYHKMDMELFAERKWAKCFSEALIGCDIADIGKYGDQKGIFALRSEICRYLEYSRNIKCGPEQIIICSGVQDAAERICRLVKPGCAAVECPTLPIWKTVFEDHGFDVRNINLYPDKNFTDGLYNTDAKLAVTTPSHQFPLGSAMPLKERLKIIDWAVKNDALIIEDDYDCEYSYSSKPISAMYSLAQDDCVLYIGTFSKLLMPSLRLNYMVLPHRLMPEYERIYSSYPPGIPWITQRALLYFFEYGYFMSQIRTCRKLMREKYFILKKSCEKVFGSSAEIIGTDAGLHILLKIKKASSDEKLIQMAGEYDVGVYSVSEYWLGESYPKNVVMLGFSYIPKDRIEEGIKQLGQAWKEYL